LLQDLNVDYALRRESFSPAVLLGSVQEADSLLTLLSRH
jgi:hypothetical protein